MSVRNGNAFLIALTLLVLSVATELYPADKTDHGPSRDSIVRIVTQIQRADYEGDRPALKRLHDELAPIPEDNKLASRVLYWRGFALWRRAINGFNESPTPTDLEADLTQAVTDFKDAIARDPSFVEPKIGASSSLGYLMYLNKKDPTRVQELLQQSSPLLKEAMATAPDNPRLLWVLGPIRWSSPPERGGGQDKAIEIYNKGLASVGFTFLYVGPSLTLVVPDHKRNAVDPLEPSWGGPELLMSLAWSNLNRTTPDLKAAYQYAESALQQVPYWHYVRDILMPQIQAAQTQVEKKTIITMQNDLAHRAPEIHWPVGFDPAKADLFSHNELLIGAACERVWQHIVDATKWPEWYPNSKDVRIVEGTRLAGGTVFRWTTFGLPLESKINEFVPYTRIGWYGYAPGTTPSAANSFYHTWFLTPEGDACRVVTDEVGMGKDAAHLRETDESLMHRGHDLWLATLKWMAEGR